MSMEASEIIRRNEAIARFMGDPSKWYGGWYKPGDMEFNEDWSHLMPAVEKILEHANSRANVPIGASIVLIAERDAIFRVFTYGGITGFGKTMIEAVWEAVSDYCLSLEA